jgi:hypothetical protein
MEPDCWLLFGFTGGKKMNTSFECLLKQALESIGSETQDRRIHACLQAALNYVMAAELRAGKALNDEDVINGLANGTNTMLAMIERNLTLGIAKATMQRTVDYFTSDQQNFLDGLQNTGNTITVSH